MQWFDKNPYGPNPTFKQNVAWKSHLVGRRLFASSYARGGFSATAFAPTTRAAWSSSWSSPLEYGSEQHLENLKQMYAQTKDKKFIETFEKVRNRSSRTAKQTAMAQGGRAWRGTKRMAKLAGGATMALLPAITTSGGLKEKGLAMAAGTVGYAGWIAGGKAGAAAGFALGLAPGAVIGGLIGAIAGGSVVEEGFRSLLKIPDTIVERERARRDLNWVGDTAAFNTQKAYTMRQQSLLAMNRGLMNSRSMLGREAIMMHQ